MVPESLRISELIHILLRVISRDIYKPDAPDSNFTHTIIKKSFNIEDLEILFT